MNTEFIYDHRIYYNPVQIAIIAYRQHLEDSNPAELRNGPVRYGDLKKPIPHILQKMLPTPLRELKEKGTPIRHSSTEKSPHVIYQLTEKAGTHYL